MNHYLQAVQQSGQTVNPLLVFLGINIERLDTANVSLSLAVNGEFVQGAGVMAGGLQATLLDEAMAHAVLSVLNPGEGTATIEMSVRYFRVVNKGDRLRAEARIVQRGKRVIQAEATASVDGAVTAKAAASFSVLESRKKQKL